MEDGGTLSLDVVLYGNDEEFCFSTLEKLPYCSVVMKIYHQSGELGNGCLHKCLLLVLEAGIRSRWSSKGLLYYEGIKRARGLCFFLFFPSEVDEICWEGLWVFLQPSEKKPLAPLHREHLLWWTQNFCWAFHFIARTLALLKSVKTLMFKIKSC